MGLNNKSWRIGIIAATYPDARDTCVEGESGLLACLPEKLVRNWNRSMGELDLANGTQYKLYTGEKPDRLRGPQHHMLWCDEIAAWKYVQDTWDMAQMGLRLGQHPTNIITSTPRPIKLIRDLFKDQHTAISSGSTRENAANLAPSFLRTVLAKYEGTRLGLQELEAKILDDIPGALWTRASIEDQRIRSGPGQYPEDIAKRCVRIVVAIDPAVSSDDESDETGIVVVGIDADNRGYVLADASCRESSNTWANIAIDLFRRFRADRIIGETNNGGDLVEDVLRNVNANIPFRQVTASRGKYVRAEPVSALYEQKRISHVGLFEHLEDQMCMFTPDNIAKQSPDRADALVWGLTELFDGCMNLGLVEHLKQEAEKGKAISQGTVLELVTACTNCGYQHLVKIGSRYHCNQCGTDVGGSDPLVATFNRTKMLTGGHIYGQRN